MTNIKFLFIGLFLTINLAFAQTPDNKKLPDPLKWNVSYSAKEAKVGDEIEVILIAQIPKSLHMTSINVVIYRLILNFLKILLLN